MNDNGPCSEDTYAEKLLSSDSPDICNIFGEPDVLPRVGDEYQVEVPSLVTESDTFCLTRNLTDVNSLPSVSQDFLMGLPLSIMWIDMGKDIKSEMLGTVGNPAEKSNEKKSVNSECIKETQVLSESTDLKTKVDPMDITRDSGIEMEESATLTTYQKMNTELPQKHVGDGYYMVPGTLGDTWSDIEEASFLLGLYIFGKNLAHVKKFVESQKMGDVLSFYYGKFYKSEKYRRWSECRKVRSRRCIYGQKIFTGARQQEFLSRLLRQVSEERKSTLLEVSKTFGDGKMLLEEYVFSLKAAVGLNALVEAVGIGKGKEDLTGMAVECMKSNQVLAVRPEIPIGKACSKLTPLEIIEFLTGDYRLSKARSNDLFWEAVWPRLLARGWHSEQPNNQSCAAGSKHSLVFLIPGVNKFSKRKLVKGNHYFDSVTDVLNKVASEPGLLELEFGADKGNNIKVENGLADETKLGQDLPDKNRHYYLKPRISNRATDAIKFTIVDTSLVSEGISGVREFRSLPVEMNASPARIYSISSNASSSEELSDESESANTLPFDGDNTVTSRPTMIAFDNEISSDRNAPKPIYALNGPDTNNMTVKIPKEGDRNMCNNIQPRKGVKDSGQRTKPDHKNHLAPVAKRRRRLTACTRAETVRNTAKVLGPRVEKYETSCCSSKSDLSANVLSQADASNAPEDKLSSACSSSKSSPVNENAGTCVNIFVEHPLQEHQPRELIDLNLPVPQDEIDGPFMMEVTEEQHDQTSKQPEDPIWLKEPNNVTSSDLQSNMNGRRQSTRNRPPTTKALEAHACGFLTVKQKRKCKDGLPSEPRPSRRARVRTTTAENISDGIVDSKVEEKANGVHEKCLASLQSNSS